MMLTALLANVNNDKGTHTKKGEKFQEASVTRLDGIHQSFAQFTISCF